MVPEGFQLIKGLGSFPSDWQMMPADSVTKKITKGTTPPKSEIVKDSGIPFLRVNNLSFEGTLDASSEMLFVSRNAHEGFLARSIAYPRDILMNIVGPPLGKISMLDNQYASYNMNQAIVIYRTTPEYLDDYYFLQFLSSELAQQWLQSRSKKTSGQQNLTIQLCKELPVPTPPLPEQRKIAKILSTWDKAISTTERLIDNSKQQKKALMQQLLTGKKRLLDDSGRPFEGEWESVLLKNIVDRPICYGVLKPGEHTEGGVPLLRIQDLKSPSLDIENLHKITNELHQEFKRTILRTGDLVISIVGTLGKVLKVPKQLDGANITRAFAVIGVSTQDTDFIKQYLSSDYIQEWLSNTATGNAQKVLNVAAIKKLQIKVPSLKEQQKIASVLTIADKETELLEQQLANLKQEKKALMQQLLTGKRRVKPDDTTVA